MIIKGVFRRYERWNPVHPTYGAFWGMGLGIGCGVGWGPGFGPEVIGYVGAGCGAGFSVGITFLGIGIGLPANYLFTVPHNAFMVTKRGALDVARASGVLGYRSSAGDSWGDFSTHITDIQQNPRALFSSFKIDNLMENMVDLTSVRSMLVSRAKRITDYFGRGSGNLSAWDKGSKS